MGDIVPNQLFVAGYSRNKVTDERDIKDIFKKFGSIKEVAYKGSYSFVTFNSEPDAQEALKAMNGYTYNGQKLKVDVVDNRKGRKTGPTDDDKCFKCGKGGHWARDCPNGRSPRRSRRYSDSRSRYENEFNFKDADIRDLILDHIHPIHHRDQGDDDIKIEERDIVEVQEGILGPKREVLVQDVHPPIPSHPNPRDRTQHQNLDKEWENTFYYNIIEIRINSFHYLTLMKRTLQDLAKDQEKLAHQYSDINALQKELYLENQKRLQQQKEIVIEDDEVKSVVVEEDVELAFPVGTFCLNHLTQYPADEKQKHIIPFINMLYENTHINVKESKPKKTLIAALMTCFGFEDELLERIVKCGVQLYIVNDNNNPDKKLQIKENYNGYQNWTVIIPSKLTTNMYGGAFHPKIWILKFPKFIRIVIGSQNLHVGDWTVWSQAMWVQDFKVGKSEPDAASLEFKTMLREFLYEILPTSHKFEDLLKINFDDYDFKDVNIRLITSIPGRYVGNQLYKYGIMRLQSVLYQEINNNKFEIPKQVSVTYQTTSIGQLEDNYVDLILQCCTGKVYKQPLPSVENNKKITQMVFKQQEEEKSKLNIIYPTADYIEHQTHGGVDFANPLFLRKQQYETPQFPKHLFHRYEGSSYYYWHTGNIPHLKVMIITGLDGEINDNSAIYVGSHNLSQGAWGKMQKNATQLYISNTELGVLYPPKKDSAKLKQQIIEQLSFKFPPTQYEKTDKPWILEAYCEKQVMEKN